MTATRKRPRRDARRDLQRRRSRGLRRQTTWPDSEVFFGYVHSRGYDTPEQAARFLADNRRLYDRQVAIGGKRYPWDAVPDLTRADWKRHFGANWGFLQRSKQLYDPAGILGPGHGIFA